MKKILFLILMLASIQASAQDMKTIISNMPDSITPLLTKNNRLDFIDYLEAGQKAEESNKLRGKSSMLKLTASRAVIATSKSSTKDFKLLTSPTPQIGIITTVQLDSTYTSFVKYYDLNWQLLKTVKPQGFVKMEWNDDNEEITETRFEPLKLNQEKFEK